MTERTYDLYINGELVDTCKASSSDEAYDIFADSWNMENTEIVERT